MNEPVTVIIPTRRRHRLVERAVGSVLNGTYPHVQIIVVDDNPPEQKLRLILPEGSPIFDSRVRVVENPDPKNAARARNVGLDRAVTQWITYLDDDDEYAPAKVEKQLRFSLERKAPFTLCGYEVRLPLRRCVRQTEVHTYEGDDIFLRAQVNTPFFMHRNDSALRFDEGLDAHEDADFFFRALKYFGLEAVYVVPEPLVIVHPQPSSRVNTNMAASWRSQRRIYFRHARKTKPYNRRRLLNRLLLSGWKHGRAQPSLSMLASSLWKTERGAAARLILNAILFRSGVLRRFVIS